MSAMTSLEICYPLTGLRPEPVFVFPSLLPVLDMTEVDDTLWHNIGSERTIFGRRYVLQERRGFPPTLLLHFFRRLHKVADRVDLVRRDHFFFVLFGAGVMVRFNTSPVGIRSSSGQLAVSLDIAVSALAADIEPGCRALDRVTLELALTLACEGQFHSVRLTKYGFAARQSSDDAVLCPLEVDVVLDNLVWADPLGTVVKTVASSIPRPEHWWDPDQQQQFLTHLQPVFKQWLASVPNMVNLQCFPSAEQLMALLKANFFYVLTDPFWVTERLPPNLPHCLLQPRRFGHVPTIEMATLPTAPTQPPTTSQFEDHSVKVSHELLAGGHFGSCYRQGRELGGFARAVVIRAVRATLRSEVVAAQFTATSEIPFNHVVRLVLPCKFSPGHDLLFLPLDALAFECTLAETLADASVDEPACLGLLLDVATGLHELHSHNLVHGRLTIERSVVVSRSSSSSAPRLVAKVGALFRIQEEERKKKGGEEE